MCILAIQFLCRLLKKFYMITVLLNVTIASKLTPINLRVVDSYLGIHLSGQMVWIHSLFNQVSICLPTECEWYVSIAWFFLFISFQAVFTVCSFHMFLTQWQWMHEWKFSTTVKWPPLKQGTKPSSVFIKCVKYWSHSIQRPGDPLKMNE